jgi:acyl-CoA thioesterase FadM
MNLYMRMLWLWVMNKFREQLDIPTESSELNFRVLPHDLDLNMHMNNGRYLTIMDLGRMDLMMRSGMFGKIRENGWMPVLGSANIRYRLPLNPFQKYTLETKLCGWNDKWFYIEQKFVIAAGKKQGAVAAYALVKGAFVDPHKGKAEPVTKVMNAIGHEGDSPALPDDIQGFIQTEDALKAATQSKPRNLQPPKPPKP